MVGILDDDPNDASAIAENGYSYLENYLETITVKQDPILPEIEVAIPQPEVNFSITIQQNGYVNITAEQNIKRITLYDVKGACVASSYSNNIVLPQEKTIYILKIDFENGCFATRKLF